MGQINSTRIKVKETKSRRASEMYPVETMVDNGWEFKRDTVKVVGSVKLDGKLYKILS